MDIDANWMSTQLAGLTGAQFINKHRTLMRGRCKVCGSKNHKAEDKHMSPVTCNHCRKNGHFASVCYQKLQGFPAATEAVHSAETVPAIALTSLSAFISASSKDHGATIASMQDSIALLTKSMSDMQAMLKANF